MGRDISVRYSDFDANGHVNNTAYSTTCRRLSPTGVSRAPVGIQIEFLKGDLPRG